MVAVWKVVSVPFLLTRTEASEEKSFEHDRQVYCCAFPGRNTGTSQALDNGSDPPGRVMRKRQAYKSPT